MREARAAACQSLENSESTVVDLEHHWGKSMQKWELNKPSATPSVTDVGEEGKTTMLRRIAK